MSDANSTTPPEGADFGNRVKRAVFWRSGTQIVAQVISWGVTLAVLILQITSIWNDFLLGLTFGGDDLHVRA